MERLKSYFHKIMPFLFLITIIVSFVPMQKANAYTIEASKYIYDDAGLLSDANITALDQKLRMIAEDWDIDIVLLTTADDHGYSSVDYISVFEVAARVDQKMLKDDSVVILINMDYREVYISGYGVCKRQISDSRIQSMLDDIMPYVSSRDYAAAFDTFLDLTNQYMGKDILPFQIWFQLLVALLIGGAITAGMAFSLGAHITTNSATYLDQANSGVRFHHDNFIRQTVTKRKKPQQSQGGGSGGSSGGRSHSGGGRKF